MLATTHPKTLAVIRVFSSTDQKVLEKHAKIIEKLYGIPTRTYCIPNQPEGIANEEIAKDCVEASSNNAFEPKRTAQMPFS